MNARFESGVIPGEITLGQKAVVQASVRPARAAGVESVIPMKEDILGMSERKCDPSVDRRASRGRSLASRGLTITFIELRCEAG